MPTTNSLSTSGDLYEGNFDEWKARLESWISYRGFCDPILPNEFDLIEQPTPQDVATHIRLTTSPAMLDRVSIDLRTNGEALFKALEKLATPFRLRDLPAEIRINIYTTVLPDEHWVMDSSDDSDDNMERDIFPPLLHTNSQIRHEALSVFYSTNRFCMDHDRLERECCRRESDMVESWMASVVRDNIKHLRCIELWIDVNASVIIRYSENSGLTCELDLEEVGKQLRMQCDCLLQEHAHSIESTRKLLGLKGEAITMALLSNWTLWWNLYFKI